MRTPLEHDTPNLQDEACSRLLELADDLERDRRMTALALHVAADAGRGEDAVNSIAEVLELVEARLQEREVQVDTVRRMLITATN
jgi:hypothetical protein